MTELDPAAYVSGLEPESNAVTSLPEERKTSLADFVWEVVQTLVIAGLLIIFFRTFIFQNYVVEGQSMQPTLQPGERLIVSRLSYYLGDPQRGDVIVLQYPLEPDRDFVKRIIGMPGEIIEIRSGQVFIEGKPLPPETYIEFPSDVSMEATQLAEDEYFVMGDNRAGSSDSRSWGPLEDHYVIGKAWLVYFPFDKFGLVPHYGLEPVS